MKKHLLLYFAFVAPTLIVATLVGRAWSNALEVISDSLAAASEPSLSDQRDSIVAEEARSAGVPVALSIAVSHTENWTGDSMAVSRVGAVGLMQVMPRYWEHKFEKECGCGSLFMRRLNACKGVRVLRFYLDSLPTVDDALRAYHGSNKPWLHAAGDAYVRSVLEQLTRVAS
jgi:transglycosylase-like protein with SLT domain